jgi:hypothetical protein
MLNSFFCLGAYPAEAITDIGNTRLLGLRQGILHREQSNSGFCENITTYQARDEGSKGGCLSLSLSHTHTHTHTHNTHTISVLKFSISHNTFFYQIFSVRNDMFRPTWPSSSLVFIVPQAACFLLSISYIVYI